MLTGQILQNILDGFKNILKKDIVLYDNTANLLATTAEGVEPVDVELFSSSQAETQTIAGMQYFKVLNNANVLEYIIVIVGNDEDTFKAGKLIAFQINNLILLNKDRIDSDDFIKDLIQDNLLLMDVYSHAKKLNIKDEVRRVVYLIELQDVKDKDFTCLEVLRNIFPNRNKDFIILLDERHMILIKELEPSDDKETINDLAVAILDTLNNESFTQVYISNSNVVEELKYISSSFKQARIAIEIGKIFENGRNIFSYDKLGIGRLIYQLSVPLCDIFLEEALHDKDLNTFDDELIITVNKFFECNLNVSETSRQLYIHRNTLVYRLDKIQKMTGLDLRNFDEAMLFKLTIMVSKYLNSKNMKLK